MDEKNTQFEQELNRSGELLTTARDQYETLEGSIPREFVEALGEIEAERNELKNKIDVNKDVRASAREVTQRAELLSQFLELVAAYENSLIEQDLYRQQCWVTQLDRNAVREELTADSNELLDELSQWVGIFQNLIASESHESIRTNSQKTISELEQDLRTVDHRISTKIPPSLYETVCSDTTDDLLDGIHDRLSQMAETHPQREAFGAQLQAVKSMRSSSKPESARIALEGSLMVFYAVSRAVCRQEHAKRLATAIQEITIQTDTDPNALAAEADVEGLLDVITERLRKSTEQSEADRLRRLLSEHDGSVSRTITAMDLDTAKLFEQLRVLYEDDHVTDLVIEMKT